MHGILQAKSLSLITERLCARRGEADKADEDISTVCSGVVL